MRQQAHKSQSRHAARACRRSLFIAHACPERMSKARGLLLTAIVIAAVKLAALHVLQGAPHTFSESSASILLTSNSEGSDSCITLFSPALRCSTASRGTNAALRTTGWGFPHPSTHSLCRAPSRCCPFPSFITPSSSIAPAITCSISLASAPSPTVMERKGSKQGMATVSAIGGTGSVQGCASGCPASFSTACTTLSGTGSSDSHGCALLEGSTTCPSSPPATISINSITGSAPVSPSSGGFSALHACVWVLAAGTLAHCMVLLCGGTASWRQYGSIWMEGVAPLAFSSVSAQPLPRRTMRVLLLLVVVLCVPPPALAASASVSVTPSTSITPYPAGEWSAVVSSGTSDHTCGIKATGLGSGNLYCWGYNKWGQLGLGYANTTGCQCVPSIPSSPVLLGVKAVALGQGHTCAILAGGTIACWGYNSMGELGLGYTNSTGCSCVLTVSAVPSLSGIVAIAAGQSHTCAATSGGTLYCWGGGSYGQLGNGGTSFLSVPTVVSAISGVVAVVCGSGHTCALTSPGALYCWGYNIYGQLGNGGTSSVLSPPGTPAIAGVIATCAGDSFTCALSSAGGVYCWGDNLWGELGLGYTTTASPFGVPTVPSTPVMTGVSQISCGNSHTCALQAGGVYCWGYNGNGVLGNAKANSGAAVLSPPGTPVVTGVTSISIAAGHSCGLTSGGDLSCWGSNAYGQLGTGGLTEVDAPASLSASPTASAASSPSTTATATPTGSVTPSVSGTSSVSVTGTESATFSATPSPTVTASLSATLSPPVSLTSTTTATITGSISMSTSVTGSGSGTGTMTVSGSASGTYTPSGSPTPTVTVTASVSASSSPSPSGTVTVSSTLSSTTTPTPSPTPTGTVTASASPTNTLTPSVSSSASGTRTASPSDSASGSGSATGSGSVSSTATVSVTASGSASLSSSGTASGSVSPSPSASLSGSVSVSPTATAAVSPSGSGTPSPSPSLTVTASVTPSASATGSVSVSNTPSVSATASDSSTRTGSTSLSVTGTGSVSVTASQTPTGTAGPSATITPSASATGSVTPSDSSSASGTGTATASLSPSGSGSVSTTGSSTGTASVSASVSITPTASLSVGALPSAAPTVTVTPSLTPSGSSTGTITLSTSGSGTSSDTKTTTATVTLSASPAGTGSATASTSATATLTSRGTATSTRSAATTVTVSPTATATASDSGSATSCAAASTTFASTATETASAGTATSTATPTVRMTASGAPSRSRSGSDTSTSTQSASGTVTVTVTDTASGSPSASVTSSGYPFSSPTATATVTCTPSFSATVSGTASVALSVSGSPTPTVSASSTPTPSVTPSPCPPGCSACAATNCTACFSGPQWQLVYSSGEGRYTCVAAVVLPPSFACGVAEESPAGTGVACPPLPSVPTGVALSLSPLTLSGAPHPFIVTTGPGGIVTLAVGPAAASLPLDYGVTRWYNITLSVCVPQAIAAFSGPGITAAYSVCEAAQHMDTSATLIIDLSPINKPPVFTQPSLSLSTPGVASPGDVVGFPLSLYAVNPNTVAPWNTLTFTVVGGRCGASVSQSSIPTLAWLPFTVVPGNGSLVYTSAVTASSLGLQAWADPLFACGTATNGGGLSASITITVAFTAVAARLSVFPTAIAVTHYALGVSKSSATVSLYVGSQVGLSWVVGSGVAAPWLVGVKASDTALVLSVNSSRLGSNWQGAHISVANVTLSTSDGLLTAAVSVTLVLSIPAAALSPTSLSQLVRQGGVADTSLSLANTGTDTLAYRIIVSVPWATVMLGSTGTVAPGGSVSVVLRANAGSLAPSLYPTTVAIQTNAPGGVAADPTAPASFAGGSILSLPWELRVVQALLFPTEVSVTVTPGTPAVTTDFSLVNFAGSPILALFPQGSALGVSASAPSLAVAQDQLGAFTLAAVYPTDTSGVYEAPGVYTVNIAIPCWKEATDSDTANVTAGFRVSPFARGDAFYVPVTLPVVSVHVMAVPGAPSASFSSVTLTTPTTTQVREPVVLWVAVRDAGNFSVPFDAAFDAVSLSYNASDSAAPLLESAVPLSLHDSLNGNSGVVTYTLLPVALGVVTIHVTVGGVTVPGGVVLLTVLGPVCTGDLVLDPASLTCVCAGGLYKDNSTLTCIPCPAGSYSPVPGNGSVAQCLPCPAGWYCEVGSVAATAHCPPLKGFDCSDGTLRTVEGYWTPIPTNVSANSSWAVYTCENPEACIAARTQAGAVQCAAGYAGVACSVCAPGYVAIGTFCVQCHYPGLSSVGVFVLPSVGVLVVSLVIALVLEESGVKRVRGMWVPTQAGLLIALLRVLFDFVQVVALQALIHAREYQWFVAGVWALTGGGLGGGLGIQTWQPFLCVLFSRESHAVYWAQLGVVLLAFPLAAVAATVSIPLSRLVWGTSSARQSRHNWWRRFGVSVMLLQWTVMLSVIRAVVAQGWNWRNGIIVITYGAAITVVMCLVRAAKKGGMQSTHSLASVVTFGYNAHGSRFLFEAVLLARKCALIWIGVMVSDSFLACLLALLSTVCVWALAVTWKPTKKQMHLRSLQTVLLSLHVLMLLQSSGHGRPSTMTVLHALWLLLLCVVLCAGVISAGVLLAKVLHPPATLVQVKGTRLRIGKARRLSTFLADAGMLSRMYRVGKVHSYVGRGAVATK